MPFKSESQRRYLFANHPDIAKRWAHEYPGQHDLPEHKRKKKTKKANALIEGPLSFLKESARAGTNGMDSAVGWARNMLNSPDMRRDGNNIDIEDAYKAEGRDLPAKQMRKRLNTKQAFKAGFLLKCAEQNLTIDQISTKIDELLIKTSGAGAALGLRALGSTTAAAGNVAGAALKKIFDLAGTAAVAVPVLAGGGIAYALNRTANKTAPEDIQHEELRNEYLRLADQARRKTKIRGMQEESPGSIVQLS